MAVNTRTEYALRALLEIADSSTEAVSAKKICQRQALPKKYIEHLLADLKAANLIVSSSGAKGGYFLSRKPTEITLADILKAVDDDSLNPNCNITARRFCPEGHCPLSSFFSALGIKINVILTQYTLAEIYNAWKGENDATGKNIS